MRLFFCVFVSFVCSVFVFVLLFWFSFLLRLKIFVCFPLYFCGTNSFFSSHVAKLSSFDPFQAFPSEEDQCKEHLVEGGLSLPYKKERHVDKVAKLGQVWRGPAKCSL